jgi:antitoxin VapB
MNTAKISNDGTQQIVILPEGFKMTGTEVYIKKVGNAIVLIAQDNPWQSLFESLDQFSDDFMTTRDQPPLDVREFSRISNLDLENWAE